MNEPLTDYLRQLEVWNYSAETIEAQGRHLGKYLDYLRSKGFKSLLTVKPEHLTAYQVWLWERINKAGKRNQPQSLNNDLSTLKSLYGWLHTEGRIAVDPAKHLRHAKTPSQLPKALLSTTDLRVLIGACDTTTLLGYRDRCLVEVLYGSAIRQGELRRLKVDSVDLEARRLMVRRGKGNKDRVVPLTKVCARYLRHYLASIRPRILNGREDGGFLFVSAKQGKLSRATVGFIVKKLVKQAGMTKRVHPHALRAACITHMLRNQGKAEQNILTPIMELAGHSSLRTLHFYTASDIHELQEIHAKTHPRELEA